MNIHEHQAKEILKRFGIRILNGVAIFSSNEISEKIQQLKSSSLVIKAQIHAGGRGKAGGIKIVENSKDLIQEAKNMFNKTLVTHQTGPSGKKVNRIYIEETCDIKKEFYLSCLVDRSSSKIIFITSNEGGIEIEKVSQKNPDKITKVKLHSCQKINNAEIDKIIRPFNLSEKSKDKAFHLVKSIFKIFTEKDASLIEINPLILTKNEDLICLDAKINFDDNALYRHKDILLLRDPKEIDPIELEASKHGLSYIKLNGKIGCMVNGAGLAMATLDIIKLYGSEPANFLDVGGGASKEKVSAAFEIILSDKNVKGILINIFGGIMRCDILAQGVVDAAAKINSSVPLVVRLEGTNVKLGKEILEKSKLKIISANNLSEAAKKIVEVTK